MNQKKKTEKKTRTMKQKKEKTGKTKKQKKDQTRKQKEETTNTMYNSDLYLLSAKGAPESRSLKLIQSSIANKHIEIKQTTVFK